MSNLSDVETWSSSGARPVRESDLCPLELKFSLRASFNTQVKEPSFKVSPFRIGTLHIFFWTHIFEKTKQAKNDVITCESGQLTSGATGYREEQDPEMCGPDSHFFCTKRP